MSKSNRFPPEVREPAVRMVQEHRNEYRYRQALEATSGQQQGEASQSSQNP